MFDRTLAELDRLEVRDLRDDILRRVEAPAGPGASPRPDPRRRRLATIAVALVISLAAAALVWRAFEPSGPRRVPAVSPTPTSQV
jgi:ferric-dicitrate binding protein FerR (iron transport regulator)